jgi:two-component system nitrogen regulation sensor histidine kinase GlnL
MQAVGESGRIILRSRALTQTHIGIVRHRLAVRIDIIDNGPGVPEEIRGTLFYPLVTARANGTGLGLAVAQELINRNGGIIEFQSEPGNTVFSITLPLVVGDTPMAGSSA